MVIIEKFQVLTLTNGKFEFKNWFILSIHDNRIVCHSKKSEVPVGLFFSFFVVCGVGGGLTILTLQSRNFVKYLSTEKLILLWIFYYIRIGIID